jgi:hypothetical protein
MYVVCWCFCHRFFTPFFATAPHGLGVLVEFPGLPVALEVDDKVLAIPNLGRLNERKEHHGFPVKHMGFNEVLLGDKTWGLTRFHGD